MGSTHNSTAPCGCVRSEPALTSMASGYGNRTPMGRCYPVYMEMKECLNVNADKNKCMDLREDYMECLHHKKEISRFNELNEERIRKVKAGEPLPATVSEQLKKGEIKLPWTNAK